MHIAVNLKDEHTHTIHKTDIELVASDAFLRCSADILVFRFFEHKRNLIQKYW